MQSDSGLRLPISPLGALLQPVSFAADALGVASGRMFSASEPAAAALVFMDLVLSGSAVPSSPKTTSDSAEF